MRRSAHDTGPDDARKALARLALRHAALARQVELAQHEPTFDDAALHALKKRKLALKDEIVRLSVVGARRPA